MSSTDISVFTTRPATILGATFLAIAKTHDILKSPFIPLSNRAAITTFAQETHVAENYRGVDTGLRVINPVTNRELPVFVSDYVLGEYGFG